MAPGQKVLVIDDLLATGGEPRFLNQEATVVELQKLPVQSEGWVRVKLAEV